MISPGAAHISAIAARNIFPAFAKHGLFGRLWARRLRSFGAARRVSRQINSPVTRRAFGEAIKQIRTVAREFGPIDCVHIELARDVGKSAEERAK